MRLAAQSLWIVLLTSAFSGCSSPSLPNAVANDEAGSRGPNLTRPLTASRPPVERKLYVANRNASTVTVYAVQRHKRLFTIKQNVSSPSCLLSDGAGRLYVANSGNHTVTVYSSDSGGLLRTISDGIGFPTSMALDPAGRLYVANYRTSTITVYAKGGTTLLRTISQGISYPVRITFNDKGYLFVANDTGPGSVTIYAPGKGDVFRTITEGLENPVGLAFDSSGNLYVSCNPLYSQGTVTVYSRSEWKLIRTISWLTQPGPLLFDNSDNLYVRNLNEVLIYAPGDNEPAQVIKQGINQPGAMALDSAGRLYVANCGGDEGHYGTVTVYAVNGNGATSKLLRTISKGPLSPSSLAFDR